MADDTTFNCETKRLDTSEARELAELYLMDTDLRHANRVLKIAIGMQISEGDKDGLAIRESLFRDAIIQLCACFGKTEPFKLDMEKVFEGAVGWKAFYDDILEYRDTYAAHRFGPNRQCEILVSYLKESDPPEFVTKVGRFEATTVGFKDHVAQQQLLSFIGTVGRHVLTKIEETEQTVTRQVISMSRKQLDALEDAKITVPGSTRVGRKKFRQQVSQASANPTPRKLGPQ